MKKAAVKLIVVVAMAAAMLVNAVVPVSAEDTLSSYEYIAVDYFGIIYLSNTPLYAYPFDRSNQKADCTYFGYKADNDHPLIILIPIEVNGTINYDIYISYSNMDKSLTYEPVLKTITENNNQAIFYKGGTTPSISTNAIQFDLSLANLGYWNDVKNYYTITANHNINRYFNNNVPTNPIEESKITVDTNLTLDKILNNSGLTTEDIENAIINSLEETNNTIITNQTTIISMLQTTNNYLTTVNSNLVTVQNKIDTTNKNLSFIQSQLNQIYNVGEGNNIPNNAPDLDNAQQNLHQSEEALTNKSESLASRAAAGINTAKTSSTQFIGTITPAVSTVTGTVPQAIESLPKAIQPMVYSMPLLSFAIWLIGLKK